MNSVLQVCLVTIVAWALVISPLGAQTIEDLCRLQCPFQNKTEEADLDVRCGNECKIDQCSRGCNVWNKALESSCQNVCNGTTKYLLPTKDLYCVMGCNYAVTMYVHKVRDEMGIPPAPALVADTLTATSLSLEWEDSKIANVSYMVQWSYAELPGAWQYYRNQAWSPDTSRHLEHLKPYTKYRFRNAILVAQQNEPIFSEPSVVISTLATGVPCSAPKIVRATAIDSTRISVSWEPGLFPNGPVLSYLLQISELPKGYSAVKDIPASENTNFYMFRNLMPEKNYSVSVAMRNSVGEGPAATTEVSTPAAPVVKDTLQPIFILGSQHTVIKQGPDMLDEPVIIYNTSHQIKGLGIHVYKKLLFVSDSAGYITRSSLVRYEAPITILTAAHLSFMPLDLSVDWLNDHLYILGVVNHATGPRWQIARCQFDGKGVTVAVAGLLTKPLHIEVDPYNGYIFWLIQGMSRSGLYRLDLADISNGVKHEVIPDAILEHPHLGAFTVDHTNFRLLVPKKINHSHNTVISVSLDGKEISDLRENIQQPKFENVLSLAMTNGLFYWISGDEVWIEEYHLGDNKYYHNAYPGLSSRSFFSISVNLPTSQPIPIPVNPPINVQAILGAEIAKISWQVPHLLGGQGKGAWQDWSYELHIVDEAREYTIFRRDINLSSKTIHDLKENTEYIIKVCAYTTSGKGPWSSEFRGKTLRIPQDGKYASILWSAAEGLLKSDVTGENVETLIHKSNLQEAGGPYYITDIAWFGDILFLVTNITHVYWYNLTNHARGRLQEIDSVGSIAVDWIGKKLYWSNPKQQLITRGNLDGSQQEPLPILTVAKELNIDAMHAYIYWSTGHAVECARLHGRDRRTYYPAELFSGKQVMGLTLDMDRRAVYWIVRSYEGSVLYKAEMAVEETVGIDIHAEKISNLQYSIVQGPLCYFSDHLLWLQDDRNAVIGDLSGQNAAVISGMSLSGLNMVAVMDPALHNYPNNSFLEAVNVIPDAVYPSSIQIVGEWKAFNVTWRPVTNVNYGLIFYEVKIEDYSKKDIIQVTEDPVLMYNQSATLKPYTKLKVTIQAFTYWGSSQQAQAMLHSPPSVPSEPTNPRVFVYSKRNPVRDETVITAAFRWKPPLSPNGIIEGYKVKCWFVTPDNEYHDCGPYHLDQRKLEYIARNLSRNSTYYFQVQAFTEIGTGALTPPVRADTNIEMPIPKLLMSTPDAVKITDFDKKENEALSRNSGPAVDLAYISQENKVFWLNEMQELLTSNLDGSNRSKILTLNRTGVSIAIDWVGRYVYWSEVDEKSTESVVHYLDLNQAEKGLIHSKVVLKRQKYIQTIDISPFKSSLFWIEVNRNGVGNLMRSKSDGTHVQPFFIHRKSRKRRETMFVDSCNCPENPAVGQAMTIDQTDDINPKIIWVDGWKNHIYLAEMDGCKCSLLVNATLNADSGLPPTSITADHKLIYWSNATEGKVYSVPKTSDGSEIGSLVRGVTAINISGVRRIEAVGPHTQPYPTPRCLSPKQHEAEAAMINNTAQSIILQLPEPERYPECINISLATVEYTVYYGGITEEEIPSCNEISLQNCSKLISYNQIVEITGLKPFSSYTFIVTLRNYYSDLEGVAPVRGSPVTFKTAPGAPSPPQNVTADVLNPNEVIVKWLPPVEFNGRTVWYEVHWRTEGTVAGVRQKGEHFVSHTNSTSLQVDDFKKIHLKKLLAGQTYFIWVRAYSQNNQTYSDSEEIPVYTFPEPNNITLNTASAYSLNISWSPFQNDKITNYTIQYCKTGSWEWKNLASTPVNTNQMHNFAIEGLLPKTPYAFRLLLTYDLSPVPYIWPTDGGFIFETYGDRPTPPGTPIVQNLRRDVYQVIWEPSKDNGAQIQFYVLEGRKHSEDRVKRATDLTWDFEPDNSRTNRNIVDDWVLVYNGTDNYWIITDLSPSLKYIFRVRARNKYGYSEFSKPSKSFDFTEAAMLAEQQELGVVLGTSIPIVIVLSVTVMLSSFYFFRRREKEKKALQIVLNNVRGPDVELATLRELPRRGNFIHHSNALYTSADIPTDEEIASLPHIRRDQITLTKFLGSGAFGEVFEGIARNLPNADNDDSRVAIKTLRKGATEQEKAEFLKEAQLMSNFKHEHILQLLGVCLDNDPNFIILELMESGDLLSFLRSSRPLIYTANALTLLDLLAMCVDVARGCRYLEEMHFVHRDLACRNCLVSSSDPRTRIVKIGDFGLARDIYKNDYYRKEGEGLLPVRWMAPESLVDGVFTSQSDVWAFGVLIWEIMTLGQQPYPARTNLEVLHYVRNGGRLGRPNNCPEDLHQLMMKCWSYNPENRPTFKYCLEILEDLKEKSVNAPLTSVHNGHYIGRTRNGGIENLGFFEDENHNSSGSWKTNSSGESQNRIIYPQNGRVPYNTPEDSERNSNDESMSTASTLPISASQQPSPEENQSATSRRSIGSGTTPDIPKYLELIYDSDAALGSDGYEVPRSLQQSLDETSRSKLANTFTDAPRTRTFSTSSTISSDSVSASYQNMQMKNNPPTEKQNLAVDSSVSAYSKPVRSTNFWREKDLVGLQQLLPASKEMDTEGRDDIDSAQGHYGKPSYCNVVKQPLLNGLGESSTQENETSSECMSEETVMTLDYAPNTSIC